MTTPKSKVITVRVVGPLAAYAQAFRSLLTECGYTPLTRVNHVQVMTHLSKWLQARGLGIRDLSTCVVEEYLEVGS